MRVEVTSIEDFSKVPAPDDAGTEFLFRVVIVPCWLARLFGAKAKATRIKKDRHDGWFYYVLSNKKVKDANRIDIRINETLEEIVKSLRKDERPLVNDWVIL